MKTFENIASLKLATLKEGQFVETGGYYSKGDGGGARYLIATPQVADEFGDHTLANGNVALIQPTGVVDAAQFGGSPVYYVATTGDDSNPGSQSLPFLTAQGAFDKFASLGSFFKGYWTIQLAAGTYSGENTFPRGAIFENALTIKGPSVGGHPNVPTCVFDGSTISSAFGFEFKRGTQVFVQDIKFQNYGVFGASDSGAGISAIDGCLLATKNVHTNNCYDGILCHHGRLYVSGGLFDLHPADAGQQANYSAIKSMFHTHHSIGALFNIDTGKHTVETSPDGPIITGVTSRVGRGVFAQENSTGHVDGLTVDNITKAVECVSSSRANIGGSQFSNCGNVGEIDAGSNIFDGGGNDFNAGTGNANDVVWAPTQTGVQINDYSGSYLLFITNNTLSPDNPTVTGSTSQEIIHTFSDFFNGHSFTRRGHIKVKVVGSLTGISGTKTLRLRMAGSLVNVLTFAPTAVGAFEATMEIVWTGNASQLWHCNGVYNAGSGSAEGAAEASNGTTTVDVATGSAVDLQVAGVLGNSGDSITVEYIEVSKGNS